MTPNIDELKRALECETNAHRKLPLMVQISRAHYPAEPEVAYTYAQEALVLAEQLGEKNWIGRGRRVVVEVRDEGPGISRSERRRLYGKYVRLSARPTGGESSTGLGLWIAKKAVESLRGRIRCTSEPGRGTVFCIEFSG